MKNCPNQVHMAPFWFIFSQSGSHRVKEASGTPPGFQNAKNPTKKHRFAGCRRISRYFPLFPYRRCPLQGSTSGAVYTSWGCWPYVGFPPLSNPQGLFAADSNILSYKVCVSKLYVIHPVLLFLLSGLLFGVSSIPPVVAPLKCKVFAYSSIQLSSFLSRKFL